nr:Ras GTPase-activating protein 1 [Polyrhizophydium stewartii]
MDSFQASAAEASQNHQRALYNPNSKDKDISKLFAKASAAQEKAQHARDRFAACEQLANAAEEDYYGRLLPELYQELQRDEEERSTLTKVTLEKANLFEMRMVESHVVSLKDAAYSISQISISDDMEKFVANHMTQQEEAAEHDEFDTPLAPGDLKRGMMSMSKPKDQVSLSVCSVYGIDTSFFGRPCFQVILHESDRNIIFSCATDTDQARDEWVALLRRYARCCDLCAQLNGFNPETKVNEKIVNRAMPKFRRSLSLRVAEAKDLRTPFGIRNVTPYCYVLLDHVNFARTAAKTTDPPIWTETFMFDDISAHFSLLRVVLLHRNRSGKDVTIGYVNVSLKQIQNAAKIDQWFPVLSFNDNMIVGTMRITCSLTNEQILPASAYDEFLSIVTDPALASVKALGRVITHEREAFARSFLDLMCLLGRERGSINLLIVDEISATDDPNIIFRGNTLATKVFDQYMKIVGAEYLQATLTPLIRAVYENGEPCETDPMRVEGSSSSSSAAAAADTLRKNTKRLLQFVNFFWECIQRSADMFPRKIAEVFAFIKDAVSRRFPNQRSRGEQIKYPAISGFLFLRFFCPAIISPHQFGLAAEAPAGHVPRTLTMIAKILQNLANMTELKDVHLSEANVFIRSQKEAMKALLDRVSTVCVDLDSPLDSVDGDVDVSRQCESLFQYFERNIVLMASSANPRPPEFDRLVTAIEGVRRTQVMFAPELARVLETCESSHSLVLETQLSNELTRMTLERLTREASQPPPLRDAASSAMAIAGQDDALGSGSGSPAILRAPPPIPPRSEFRIGGVVVASTLGQSMGSNGSLGSTGDVRGGISQSVSLTALMGLSPAPTIRVQHMDERARLAAARDAGAGGGATPPGQASSSSPMTPPSAASSGSPGHSARRHEAEAGGSRGGGFPRQPTPQPGSPSPGGSASSSAPPPLPNLPLRPDSADRLPSLPPQVSAGLTLTPFAIDFESDLANLLTADVVSTTGSIRSGGGGGGGEPSPRSPLGDAFLATSGLPRSESTETIDPRAGARIVGGPGGSPAIPQRTISAASGSMSVMAVLSSSSSSSAAADSGPKASHSHSHPHAHPQPHADPKRMRSFSDMRPGDSEAARGGVSSIDSVYRLYGDEPGQAPAAARPAGIAGLSALPARRVGASIDGAGSPSLSASGSPGSSARHQQQQQQQGYFHHAHSASVSSTISARSVAASPPTRPGLQHMATVTSMGSGLDPSASSSASASASAFEQGSPSIPMRTLSPSLGGAAHSPLPVRPRSPAYGHGHSASVGGGVGAGISASPSPLGVLRREGSNATISRSDSGDSPTSPIDSRNATVVPRRGLSPAPPSPVKPLPQRSGGGLG